MIKQGSNHLVVVLVKSQSGVYWMHLFGFDMEGGKVGGSVFSNEIFMA